MRDAFIIEVDHSLNPIYGSLHQVCFKQFITSFIINDESVHILNHNKEEIIDIVLNYSNLMNNIQFLIGDNNISDYIKIIQDNLSISKIQKILEIFEMKTFENYLEKEHIYQPIQVAGSLGKLVDLLITVIVSCDIISLIGKKKIYGIKPYGQNIETIKIDEDHKKFILIINLGDTFQKKILKININPNYFQAYLNELKIYDKLRKISEVRVAEYTEAGIVPANCDINGKCVVSIKIDDFDHTFEFKCIKNLKTLLHFWKDTIENNKPINIVYLSGNYYDNIIDFSIYLKKLEYLRKQFILVCIYSVLHDIDIAYNDIGFIHGDMKIDNILIKYPTELKKLPNSIIFDLDFSYIFEKSIETVESYNLPVNRYLKIEGISSKITREFLHFFDIYIFYISLNKRLNDLEKTYILLDLYNSYLNNNNSTKYYYIISKLTYDINIKVEHFYEILKFSSIEKMIIDFKHKPIFKLLSSTEITIYTDIHDICAEQRRHIIP